MYKPFFHRGNLITIFFLLLLSHSIFAQLNVTPDQPDSYYEVGETAMFNVTSDTAGTVNYTLKYDNFASDITSGSFNISAGQSVSINHQATASGVVICEVQQTGNTASTAAAFSPYSIEAFVDEPADFDDFWNNQKNILSGVPIDPELTFFANNDYSTTYRINLANIDNRRIYGYITVPDTTGTFPAFVTFPPFGIVADLALPEPHIPERANTISLTITIHNAEPDVVDPNAYEPNDVSDKDELYYKHAILAGVRCIDYLFTRSDFDGVNLGVMGVSQGAGLSTIVAGVDSRVKYLIMSNPVLSQNTGLQFDRAGGFPNYINTSRIEVGTAAHEALVSQAVRYYDAIYFARRFQGLSWTFISYKDVITPAATSFATFNALRGQKFLTHSLDLGHNHPADFWGGRFDFFRRFIPATQNPLFPFAPTTQGYYINAGDDITIDVNTSTSVNLAGNVEYNTAVNPSFDLKWKKLSGPGDITFSNPNSYNTLATFTEQGEYIIQLQADDYSNDLFGEQKYYTIFDDIKVTVIDTISVGLESGALIPTNPSLLIFPNPAENYLKIDSKFYMGDDLEISIFNAYGSLLLEKSIENVSEEIIEISTKHLDSGSYFVKMKSGQYMEVTVPLVIVRD